MYHFSYYRNKYRLQSQYLKSKILIWLYIWRQFSNKRSIYFNNRKHYDPEDTWFTLLYFRNYVNYFQHFWLHYNSTFLDYYWFNLGSSNHHGSWGKLWYWVWLLYKLINKRSFKPSEEVNKAYCHKLNTFYLKHYISLFLLFFTKLINFDIKIRFSVLINL